MHEAVFFGDDQCALELSESLGIDAEVCLKWELYLHALWNIDKRSSRPDGGVERGEHVVLRRNQRAEIFSYEFRMFSDGGIHVAEDDTLLFEFAVHAFIHDFGFILCGDAGKIFFFRFGDTDPVIGFLDFVGEIFPGCGSIPGCLEKIGDVAEINRREIRSPCRQFLLLENIVTLQAKLFHPRRFALDAGNILDGFSGESAFGFVRRNLRHGKAEGVVEVERIIFLVCVPHIHLLRSIFPSLSKPFLFDDSPRQRAVAGSGNGPAVHDECFIRRKESEEGGGVRDKDEGLLFRAMSFEKVADNLLRVDIDTGVEFVKKGDLWREHRPDKGFELFLFAAGESVVETAMKKRCGNSEFFRIVFRSLPSFQRACLWQRESQKSEEGNAWERRR